jgi:hypothetical protein
MGVGRRWLMTGFLELISGASEKTDKDRCQ